MGEWKIVTIDEIKADSPNALATGPFGSAISSRFFTDKGVPVIRGGNLSDNISIRFSEEGLTFVSKDKAKEFKRSEVRKGDLIFTCWGTINQVGLIDGKGTYPLYIISNKQMKLTPHPEKADSLFLYYSFSSPQMQDLILTNNIGSSVPGFNLGQLKTIELNLPPLPEQKAITSVLSSLDDKIDLLQSQNKTLEAMAETLFRQWFVEEVQEDWEEISLQEFLDFKEGPGIRNWQYTDYGVPFINIRLISDGEINVKKANFVSEQEANGKYSHFHLRRKDMIVSTSGTLGKAAIIRDYHLPLLLNTSVIRFRPKDGINYSFMYEYLKSREFYENLITSASGSAQLNFGPIHLKQIVMMIPPDEHLRKFRKVVDLVYKKIESNYTQIHSLKQLRDILLPKLINGEVRVDFEN